MPKFRLGLAASITSLALLLVVPVLGLETKSERTFFRKSPRLLDVVTTFRGARVGFPTYYYTIELPAQSGEPLKTIVIRQRQGFETIDYYPDKTIAFQGTPEHRGNPLVLQDSQWDKQTETMTITLDPPVSPGTVFTVGLKPIRNPEYGGIYLFGVTVFPPGDNPLHLYLGSGRLDFYGSDSGDFN